MNKQVKGKNEKKNEENKKLEAEIGKGH